MTVKNAGLRLCLSVNLHRKEIDAQFDGRIAFRLKRDGSWMVEIPYEVPDFWG